VRKIMLLGLIFGIFTPEKSAFAFTELGNGIDSIFSVMVNEGSPWFLSHDERVVTACVEDFPEIDFPKPMFEAMASSAFDFWREHTTSPILTEVRLARRLEFHANCTGYEDLTFNIVSPRNMERVYYLGYSMKAGYRFAEAIVTHQYPGSLWHRGIINIVGPDFPLSVVSSFGLHRDFRLDWHDPEKISALIFHEVGHTFGLSHDDDDSFMDPRWLKEKLLKKSN
jgi:hypothetical protein